MMKENENTNPSTEKELFAARLRTLADLVETDKIPGAIVYAFISEVNPPIFSHVFAGDFRNCCEEDYSEFLDEMHTWTTSVHMSGGVASEPWPKW